ncbi:MAG: Potassium-transporting ATPase KdpC subunit [Chroococcidiopsis cubana SAG 39.79]|uniref:Potassium-transporting ATPase KdpC subunit n=1 Tax=Chroococcidiopsis cubana SAG 39.79 TaxID=388085 RepID=A0AB37UP55_9CYAN|nr:K(+)-transporting ATPase subunit C [Chroococcidiopsis cubana]MDZ4871618.1 Potassium-transporting ATPase KdpC subunit [Chroococcidiopsis cubana SAG 39.79]RUT12957.1 potassium-transporting ATPase KdpC subunit [Chroococcidiopsis cubana SAG 39.79]
MSIFREILRGIRLTLALWLLTAVLYPGLILLVGQLPFLQSQANGSIVVNLENQPVGSVLTGQPFTSERYFQSRPSTVDYSTSTETTSTGVSGASNLAPSNPELLKRIEAQAKQLQENGIQPTADLVYTSGSGLDPHITLEAVEAQLVRVAKARNFSTDEIVPFVNKHTQGRFLGIFGEPGVNVLKLNQELDVLEITKGKS